MDDWNPSRQIVLRQRSGTSPRSTKQSKGAAESLTKPPGHNWPLSKPLPPQVAVQSILSLLKMGRLHRARDS